MTHIKTSIIDINGTKGQIVLATLNPATYLNLIVDTDGNRHTRLGLTPAQAKKLRDDLLEIYPVDAPKLTGTRADVVLVDEVQSRPFKVGDKVRVKTTRHDFGRVKQSGMEGTVRTTTRFGELSISVDFDIVEARHRGAPPTNVYAPRDLELIQPATDKGMFIVSAFDNGSYKPSSLPVVHSSQEKADAEAERLAKQHGGSFRVLRLVSEASRAKPVVPPVTKRTF